jgi:hypothetical protein
MAAGRNPKGNGRRTNPWRQNRKNHATRPIKHGKKGSPLNAGKALNIKGKTAKKPGKQQKYRKPLINIMFFDNGKRIFPTFPTFGNKGQCNYVLFFRPGLDGLKRAKRSDRIHRHPTPHFRCCTCCTGHTSQGSAKL